MKIELPEDDGFINEVLQAIPTLQELVLKTSTLDWLRYKYLITILTALLDPPGAVETDQIAEKLQNQLAGLHQDMFNDAVLLVSEACAKRDITLIIGNGGND